jgi:hypothetical protein
VEETATSLKHGTRLEHDLRVNCVCVCGGGGGQLSENKQADVWHVSAMPQLRVMGVDANHLRTWTCKQEKNAPRKTYVCSAGPAYSTRAHHYPRNAEWCKKTKKQTLAVWCEVLRCRVPFSTHEPRPTVTKSAPLQPTAAWIAPSASPPICSSQQLASTVPGLQHASAASSVDRGSTCVVAICARVPRPAADKHTALASIIPAHDKRIGKRFGSDGRWAMLIKRGQRPLVEAI